MRWLMAFLLLATTAHSESVKIRCAGYEDGVPAYSRVPTAGITSSPGQKLYCGVTVEVLEKRQDGWVKVKLPVSGSMYFVAAIAVEGADGAALSPVNPGTDTSKAVFQLLMTPDEFRDSGIDSLTQSQRAALAKWLIKYTQRIASSKPPTAAPRSSFSGTTDSVIETHIEGDFEGWEGDTIFKLDNGQIWQQSEYNYTYHYAYRPEVLIYWSPNSSCYKLKVEDVDDQVCVKQLK